jgi:uncharacterized membrane protein YkoI
MTATKLALALLLPLSAGTVAAQAVSGPADVTARLQAAGYSESRDVEFDGGLWEAEVRAADGRWHDVAIDAATGDVLDGNSSRPVLTAAQVTAALAAAGYADVRDLDLDDAVWEADAVAADGRRVELRLNGHTGKVIAEEQDD